MIHQLMMVELKIGTKISAMKNNELRIGNWIEVLGYVQIKNGNDIDIIIRGGDDGANGIHLTPEILDKMGFYKVDVAEDIFYHQLDHDKYDIFTGDKNGFCEVVFSLEDVEMIRVNYVHKLQNIYFYLTSTELEINL